MSALSIGTRLGPYEITAALGAGGMGEVFRARDTKLGRDVAIKVLPSAFAQDQERLARFEREARVLASLNHANIAHVYGYESATLPDGSVAHFLAMELVDGEDLAERLKRGAIPVDEAIGLAKQIAEGLEEAHEKGIVHRDLKPANIKLTADGKVKVLDFGLAKAWTGDGAGGTSSADGSHSPTMTRGTEAGVILGTAAYMSPEQARGKPVDKRADIWAFGVVLYEMLTGKRLFTGETASDVLAAVLKTDFDWSALPAEVPPSLRRLLRHCLERDPRQRLHDMGDARIELQEMGGGSTGDAPAATRAAPRPRPRWTRALGSTLALAALAGAFAAGRAGRAPRGGVARLEIVLPQGQALTDSFRGAIAISPDDRAVAFVAEGGGTARRLFLRWLAQTDARALAGTDNADDPFFSPDGRSIGFFADGQLKKISLGDGTVLGITPITDGTGASWAPDGTIVFAPGYSSGLVRVPATGGEPRPLTVRDAAAGEAGHTWPDILPDGEHVLYTIEHVGRSFEEATIAVVSLRTGKSRVVLRGGSAARYSPSGHLVYGRGSRLLAVPFDLRRLEVSGEATTIADGVAAEIGRGRSHFALSRAGSLVYVPGELNVSAAALVWTGRDGVTTPASHARRGFSEPSLAPDGQRVLLRILGADDDIWLNDLSRDVFTRLTFGTENAAPVWSADGKRFAWSSDRDGGFNIYVASLDSPATAERLTTSGRSRSVGGWSPDGSQIVYTEEDPATRGDIWTLPLAGDRRPKALVKTAFDERFPELSPDGRWLAYLSDETGRLEVNVQTFPDPGQRRQVSDAGASGFPDTLLSRPLRWSRDGRELFYWNRNRLMSVPIRLGPTFDSGRPRLVFEMADASGFDVAPDGRFLIAQAIKPTPLRRIVVALGGASEIGRPSGDPAP